MDDVTKARENSKLGAVKTKCGGREHSRIVTKKCFVAGSDFASSPKQVRFVGDRPNTGYLKEWTLMLHGTREAPYSDLPVTDPHSKLAIVKKAHEDKKKM